MYFSYNKEITITTGQKYFLSSLSRIMVTQGLFMLGAGSRHLRHYSNSAVNKRHALHEPDAFYREAGPYHRPSEAKSV